ncbi:MAG: S-methyl-5-thioribose kinase [Spirochaetes bacterium]|nr:S-methyl-5-thioribose kinase [Spirochaetota bacterium]
MSRFYRHFRMTEADAAEFAAQRLTLFAGARRLEAKEIGDGNINYIFRVVNPENGVSAIIKHADLGTRSGTRILGVDRSRIEAELLKLEGELAPGLVPRVYDYDPVMACRSMEDLSDHRILRYELIGHRTFPRLAGDISDFLVKTMVPTLDMVMDPIEKKELVKRYINPRLCQITEQLVYTEPYTGKPERTRVFPPNAEFMTKELFGDEELRLEVAKLKYSFMNDAQALIHGDLHSGSIFVTRDSTKVFDPEFAYFGPIGYDLGNFVGNLCFARANAQTTMGTGPAQDGFIGWIDETIVSTVDLFKRKFLAQFKASVRDEMGMVPGYAEWFLDGLLADSAGAAGLEINRRLVGVAQVKDITGIADPELRARAERVLVRAAKRYIKARAGHVKGEDFRTTIEEAAAAPDSH